MSWVERHELDDIVLAAVTAELDDMWFPPSPGQVAATKARIVKVLTDALREEYVRGYRRGYDDGWGSH